MGYTLIKRNARTFLATVPSVSIGACNYASPGLATSRHLSITIGDYILRADLESAKQLRDRVNEYVSELERWQKDAR